MKMHEIRGFIAAGVAIVGIILLAAVATTVMGMEIPVLVDIAAAFGVEPGDAE